MGAAGGSDVAGRARAQVRAMSLVQHLRRAPPQCNQRISGSQQLPDSSSPVLSSPSLRLPVHWRPAPCTTRLPCHARFAKTHLLSPGAPLRWPSLSVWPWPPPGSSKPSPPPTLALAAPRPAAAAAGAWPPRPTCSSCSPWRRRAGRSSSSPRRAPACWPWCAGLLSQHDRDDASAIAFARVARVRPLLLLLYRRACESSSRRSLACGASQVAGQAGAADETRSSAGTPGTPSPPTPAMMGSGHVVVPPRTRGLAPAQARCAKRRCSIWPRATSPWELRNHWWPHRSRMPSLAAPSGTS